MRKMRFRRSLVTNIITVFLFFNIISTLFFTYYVVERESNENLENAKKSVEEITKEKGKLISLSFERIAKDEKQLKIWVEKFLDDYDGKLTLDPSYILNSNGTITQNKNAALPDNQQSGVFIAPKSGLTDKLIQEINFTKELDPAFAQILESEEVTWAYIVTENNLLRVMPYTDMQSMFTSDHSQTEDVFYKIAKEDVNPGREAVWTKPYVDYLGKGWTVTCSQPIYNKDNTLYGVICLDVAVDKIKAKYFTDFALGSKGKLYWLGEEGNIYYNTDYSEEAEVQGEVFEKNIYDDSSLSDRKKDIIKNAISGEKELDTFTYTDEGRKKIISYCKIEGIDSTLILEIDQKEFIANNVIDATRVTVLIFISLFLALIFGVILFMTITKPMNKLVNTANRIAEGDYDSIKLDSDVSEIDVYEVNRLFQAFKTMKESIESYTENLRKKNKEIQMIIDTVEGALMISDLEGNIKIKSKSASDFPMEIIKKGTELIREKQTSFSEELVLDGEVYRSTYYPIRRNGVIEEFVISSDCITQHILMEKELQQIEKMAGIGQISAAIVHELKNSLALIKGAAYIIGVSSEDNEEEVINIKRAVTDAENVITTLLDFSKKDESGIEMIHVGTLIQQILLLAKKEIISKGITIETEIDDTCYSHSESREALKVILQNLILNGIQAAPIDGKINIKCVEDHKKIDISITDDGEGIKTIPKEKVFEPFFTTKSDGNGIGLWITKRLVEAMGGNITIAEDYFEGTRFKVVLPKKEERENDD